MIDFLTLKKPSKPNNYLACTESFCTAAQYDMLAPLYDHPLGEVKAAWDRVIARQPRVTQTKASSDGWQIEYEQRSKTFGFPDSITVRFAAEEGAADTTRVLVFSQAQKGYYDFGVNKKRVTGWLSELDRELAGQADA